ncbi:Carbon-nitrogen hydrolase [Pleurostoma richardsiae]|uniref:Carbon-nitrogen hydrolase n=1 Tax=Pleurostoma richardsiae TaxID=41990 RepID=A0AA38RCG3_9PEZI|nr:Carbon-nitrogen hydrolase [Pleurostoma richardsiae]
MAQKIRLATASPATQASTAATLAQLSRIAHRAASLGVDILLLPEAYLGGYPRGATFGCAIGARSEAGRDEYLDYFRKAVDLGDTVGDGGAGAGRAWVRRELAGDAVGGDEPQGTDGAEARKRGDGTREELERIARETGVFLVTGLIEKAGGSLYCAAVYVCPKQGIIGKRRKVMPTASERLIWAQGSPATLRAVSTVIRGVRINMAAAICWESYMPLLRQALYAQNINLYLAPTADGRDAWLGLLRTVGVEGRCFVVSSNMCVRGGTAAPATNGHREEAVAAAADRPVYDPRRRRSSAITEEGFEIALPSLRSEAAPRGKVARRRSVLDEDGNEIVLCAKESVVHEETIVNEEAVAAEGEADATAANGIAPNAVKQPAVPFISRGGSSIVSPFGDVLAGPQWEDDEGIVCADVDFDDCIRGRLDLDAAGSYSRNDSFKFSVEGLDLSPLPYA